MGYKIITYLIETPLNVCLERVEKRNLTADCPLDQQLVKNAYRDYLCNLPLIIKVSDKVIRIDGLNLRKFDQVQLLLTEKVIDFDAASKAWMQNKKKMDNGTYKYICGTPTNLVRIKLIVSFIVHLKCDDLNALRAYLF